MSARLAAVCLGPGGIPKARVDSASVHELGLDGDGHRYVEHGGRDRAVCLLSRAEVHELELEGVVHGGPGAFGENLLVEGLDLRACRPGDCFRIGSEVVIELSDVRAPCHTLKALDARFPDLMLGRSGYMARVLRAGTIAPRDTLVPTTRPD
jgi:MOSC domain-containing protein YiiM